MGKTYILLYICILLVLYACNTNPLALGDKVQKNRIFTTSFELVTDFDGFYIVPQNEYDSRHELSVEVVHDGSFAHKAWITKARAESNDGIIYLPHRAYPTIQLHKTAEGAYVTPCLISFMAYLDITLTDRPSGSIDDWFSFATLSPDASDNWVRTVLVNIAPDGYLRLVHVPNQGEQQYLYQVDSGSDQGGELLFPYKTWVKIDILIDFSSSGGYAKVWQNGTLVSHAAVKGGNGTLEQAHFGLYASAAIPAGTVYNDALIIREVNDEASLMLNQAR